MCISFSLFSHIPLSHIHVKGILMPTKCIIIHMNFNVYKVYDYTYESFVQCIIIIANLYGI